jgi:hypothetical protein
MASRWDLLFEIKPVPILEHLVSEASKLLANDLRRWPLPVQELDLETGKKFAALATGQAPRPADGVFREAFRLARWDLGHELSAYDEYMRNERWAQAGLVPSDKPALLFVSRWLLDQMTSLREATEGRVQKHALLELLDRTERALL